MGCVPGGGGVEQLYTWQTQMDGSHRTGWRRRGRRRGEGVGSRAEEVSSAVEARVDAVTAEWVTTAEARVASGGRWRQLTDVAVDVLGRKVVEAGSSHDGEAAAGGALCG